MRFKIFKLTKYSINLFLLSATLCGQFIWNEPPDTIYYGNQSRWVEVILPRPNSIKAETINQNQVKLTIDDYWTSDFVSAYTTKFGYIPDPGRYSLYRDGIALSGVGLITRQYIDDTTIYGNTYSYQYMASDKNYQVIGGLQHWSPRSLATIITVGESQSTLSSPSNFKGFYDSSNFSIRLEWDKVNNATSYILFKSFVNPENNQWQYLALPVGNVNQFLDSDLISNLTYFYQILALNSAANSDRSSTIMVTTGVLSIEEEEYWWSVKKYEEDKKYGVFRCDGN